MLTPISYSQYSLPFKTDLVMFLFALAGIATLAYRKKWLILSFLAIFLLVPFILQSSGSYLSKHFVFMPFLLSIPAGLGLYEVLKKAKVKKIIYGIFIILVLLLLFNLGNYYGTPNYFLDESPTSQLKDYIVDNVNENDLIVTDSRIYTARSLWIATPNHHLNVVQFSDFFNQHQQLPDSEKIPVTVHFIECTIDDCGWGTIKNQPELNASINAFFDQMPEETVVAKISGKKYGTNELTSKEQGPEIYTVYKQQISLNPDAVAQTDLSNAFYFAPYLYKDTSNYIFDYSLHSS